MPKTIPYDEALAAIEDFMEASGIRKYCSEVCKGGCCSQCSLPRKGIGCPLPKRNILCSAFLCSDVLSQVPLNIREILASHKAEITIEVDGFHLIQDIFQRLAYTTYNKNTSLPKGAEKTEFYKDLSDVKRVPFIPIKALQKLTNQLKEVQHVHD